MEREGYIKRLSKLVEIIEELSLRRDGKFWLAYCLYQGIKDKALESGLVDKYEIGRYDEKVKLYVHDHGTKLVC